MSDSKYNYVTYSTQVIIGEPDILITKKMRAEFTKKMNDMIERSMRNTLLGEYYAPDPNSKGVTIDQPPRSLK